MSVTLVTVSFDCADCGQRDTLDLQPPKARDRMEISLTGHLCFRCRLRAKQLSDRRRSIFAASRQTGR